jgi:hypothetical protein
MTVTKLHFSSLKSSSSISVGPNLSTVSVLSARRVRYTRPTAKTSAIVSASRVYSGTYTQIGSVLNITFTATYAVTATDYYFSGTATDITVRYVGPGGYSSIASATTSTTGAPTAGTYIYVTNTTTNIVDRVNSSDVNLVFAYSTTSYFVDTGTTIDTAPLPLVTMYGSRPGHFYINAPTKPALVYNFTDLTPCMTVDSSATAYSTVTSVGVGSQIISYGRAESIWRDSRHSVYTTNSTPTSDTSTWFGSTSYSSNSKFTIAGNGNSAFGSNSGNDFLVAVNIWTGTGYLADTKPITLSAAGGNDAMVSAVLWPVGTTATSSVALNGGSGNDYFSAAGPRYAFTGSMRIIMQDVSTIDYCDLRMIQNPLGTPITAASGLSGRASQGGAGTYFNIAQSPSTAATTATSLFVGTEYGSLTNLSIVTTGTFVSSSSAGNWWNIVLSNLTLTNSANAIPRTSGFTLTNWTRIVGDRDLFSTQTVFINGMGS